MHKINKQRLRIETKASSQHFGEKEIKFDILVKTKPLLEAEFFRKAVINVSAGIF